MPIDLDRALGYEIPGGRMAYTEKDVILYHLGLGAGRPATSHRELAYTFERDLRVLPTFGVIPALADMSGVLSVPGLEFDPAKLLHGEHVIELRKPLAPAAILDSTGRITNIWDKGRAAVVVLEITSRDAEGDVVCVNQLSMFLRDEGGFGGEPGPAINADIPDREPDAVSTIVTFDSQALLYRLSGDWLPLHADPELARSVGFERPILHGLCTYGMVVKAVVDEMLGGDVALVRRVASRFAGVVYPGDELVVSMWRDDTHVTVAVHNSTRNAPALTAAGVDLVA